MAELTIEEKLKTIDENISKIENKDFNVYFFVLDTKGNPSGSLEYIYQTAFLLKELGYNVTLLHQEDEYVGAVEWLGEKYADIPVKNVQRDNVEIGPSDFLVIPEVLANVMMQTKKLPCKRIMLLENYTRLTEFIPVGMTPMDYGIFDCITTTEYQKQKMAEFLPGLNTIVVKPGINNVFRPLKEPKKLIVNVISREQTDVNRLIKEFYWKYPIYKWVSFRELRGYSQETFAEAIRESDFTIWIDDETKFGYSLLEALRCESIVLAKTPKTFSDWMIEKDEEGRNVLTNACTWFDDIDMLPDMVASAVRSWTLDKIPETVKENTHKFDDLYTMETMKTDVEYAYGKMFNERKEGYTKLKTLIQKNNK